MKLDPEQASYQVESIGVVKSYPMNLKIMKNISKQGDTYYLLVKEPKPQNISSPKDIKTLSTHKVGESEDDQDIIDELAVEALEYFSNSAN